MNYKEIKKKKVGDENEETTLTVKEETHTRCPYCGGTLVERNGPYGNFWGCKGYPHCRFTASVDPQTGELKMNG